VDHHDDWTHGPPDGPDPHDGDPFGHDPLGDHDALGPLGDHDPLDDHDPSGTEHLADAGDPYGHGEVGGFEPDLRHDADLGDADRSTVDSYSTVDGDEPAEPGVDAHVFGVDHDLPPGDLDPAVADFPPPLDLPDRPEPGDGYPWSDADTLGDPGTGAGWPQPLEPVDAAPPLADLLSFAGVDPPGAGVDPWAALVDSDDPAVSALARWWGPVS
jgi:hypothetical protein